MDQNTIDRIKRVIRVGDIICYRPNLVKVLTVEEDGCWIRDGYGLEQKIDWEDIDMYNPRLKDEEPDEDEEEEPGFAGYLNNLFKRAFSCK